ncbi:MAG: hypothetical protein WC889_20610 [Myxococcota bacterium]|jgi:hypothetical protein
MRLRFLPVVLVICAAVFVWGSTATTQESSPTADAGQVPDGGTILHETSAPAVKITAPVKPVKPHSYDIGNDRILTLSTSQTMPDGMSSITDYDVLVLNYSYGFTDDLQFTLTFVLPVAVLGVLPSLKCRIINTEHFDMAISGYAGVLLSLFGGLGAFAAGAGLSFDYCSDAVCSTVVSLSIKPGIAGVGFNSEPLFSLASGLGSAIKVSRSVKILVEVEDIWGFSGRKEDNYGLFTLNYGVRFFGDRFSGDIGFVRPIFTHDRGNVRFLDKDYQYIDYLPLGAPWLSFTYQW